MATIDGRTMSTFRAEGGSGPSRQRVAAVVLLVLGLAFAAGVGGGRSLTHVGGPGRIVSTRSYGGDLLVVMLAVLVTGLGLLAYATRPVQRGSDEPELAVERQPGAWKAWLVVSAALLVVLGAAAAFILSRSRSTIQAPPFGAPPGQSAPHLPPVQGAASLPPVHWWGFAAVAALLVAGAAAIGWLRRRDRGDDLAATGRADELRAAVDLSLDDLEHEPDPRRAVIRAYGRMEAALELHGLGRRPFETALEFLARTLVSRRVSRRAATRLTDLFGRAKFSQHDVDATMKRDALAALARIRDELGEAER